jgi:hypothetical protein
MGWIESGGVRLSVVLEFSRVSVEIELGRGDKVLEMVVRGVDWDGLGWTGWVDCL